MVQNVNLSQHEQVTWRAIPLHSLLGFCLDYSSVKEKRAGKRGGDKEVALLSGKQRPEPANVVHQGDLLIWTLQYLCWEVLPSPLCPASCCCGGGASPFPLCCTLERHLLCVLLVVVLGN